MPSVRIESGEGDDATIGSDRIAGALREARLDPEVGAVVLRVNSPGGSALASDVIWRETVLLKRSRKALVASMSDLAASGGYYISCAADHILAQPNTITGSIGVFGVLPSAGKLLKERIGLDFDGVKLHDHADAAPCTRPFKGKPWRRSMSPSPRFMTLSSAGWPKGGACLMRRWMPWPVAAFGPAKTPWKKDLVDGMGNLQDAIEMAADMASLTTLTDGVSRAH